MNYLSLSEESTNAIRIAQLTAKNHSNGHFGSGHLLVGLLHEDTGIIPILEGMGKDVFAIMEWAQFRVDNYAKSSDIQEEIRGDEKVEAAFKYAETTRKKYLQSTLDPLFILDALVQPDISFTEKQLKRFPITSNEMLKVLSNMDISESISTKEEGSKSTSAIGRSGSSKALLKYCEDLTQIAREGGIDPVYGREGEIRELIEILGKRISPNVMLTGEPGVGKTAVVGGLALKILENRVPESMKNASIFELDVNGRLIAGAYKGEVEERLKKVIDEIKGLGNAILFIDEIHVLLDEKSSVGSGAVNLLKPELARGQITVIGATTNIEYNKFIATDEAFERRFSKIEIEEPNEELAFKMLSGVVPKFEEHHNLKIEPESIKTTITLAKRYIAEKNLPVSAISLMDQTMSVVNAMKESSQKEFELLEQLLDDINVDASKKEFQHYIKDFEYEFSSRMSPIITYQLKDGGLKILEGEHTEIINNIRSQIKSIKDATEFNKTQVIEADLAAVLSSNTGIRIGAVNKDEQEKLQNIESHLKNRVLGQDHVLKVVADTIKRSRIGLREKNKPNGAFFFVGPTGTGKTELAKALAEMLYDDRNALLRFDMSEFKEAHSAALLYGAPPGYVGYKEGGLLINQIRQRPHSVVLFDEIEKAHKNVFDVFLQILDEGVATDKLNRKGKFNHSVVIFTSNIGSEWIAAHFKEKKLLDKDEMRTMLQNAKNDAGQPYFRPELLGRDLQIVPFSPITKEIAPKILDIHLKKFLKLTSDQGFNINLDEKAKNKLTELGFSEVYGARPLKDAIQYHIGTPLADKIIRGEIKKENDVIVSVKSNLFNWIVK